MTIILLIVLIAGMLCVAAWRNQPPRTILGALRSISGYLVSWALQETSGDVALADNEPIHGIRYRELPLINGDFSGWGTEWRGGEINEQL